ncbi:hypothetical protein SEA_WOFFORD_137 [Streptomyces phage Wofford]|uniref:Uncharacterized protein n=1 Tax=Streptomyces phage Wofford TaxID=2283267 RepID=A0A345M9Y6_9CAUD|nr:hypothetical protein HWB78_gp148 [Streptomyces phage Wollford]AXH67307.1 hypothetical protein SEA_WOFFORD_137 [Streptomyces phage Wollford]
MDYDEYMKRYEGFKQCERCGKYDMPPTRWPNKYSYRMDYSMVCDGIPTWGPDPFAEEIHGDHSDYFMCDGERYESGQDI